MNIRILSDNRTICQNRNSLHNYFAWPSVARLEDGTLAMVTSGFRLAHLCPFGKDVICYSRDEGNTWTHPAVVIDTPLDDRDCGIAVGKNGTVLITSFNNTVKVQREWLKRRAPSVQKWIEGYLDTVDTTDAEERFLGSIFAISRDGGYTFSDPMRIPVTNPHGPIALDNGDFLYIGSVMDGMLDRQAVNLGLATDMETEPRLACYLIHPDGSYARLSSIPDVEECSDENILSCEPHAIRLADGRILVHIRVQRKNPKKFSIYQSISTDGGKSFSVPVRLLGECGGAPAHLLSHSSGVLISTYGYREQPYGIRAMLSKDGGKTWQTDLVLWDKGVSDDLGYPCSVELKDGSILTVYYEHEQPDGPAVIRQIVWNIE